MKITRMLSLICVLIVTVAVAACSSAASPTAVPTSVPAGASTTAPTGAATPQDAVKNFFAAVYGGQDTSALICSASANAADPFMVAAAASRAAGGSVDTSALTFTVKSQTGTTATVTVGGDLAYNVITSTTTAEFPSTDVSVVNEGGTWKFCGPAS